MSKIFNPENHGRLSSDERRKLIPPEKILEMMRIRSGDVLLDAGAGKGYFAIPSLSYVGEDGKVIAADISQQMLDLLMQEAPETINLQPVLCEKDFIDLSEKSVDKILMAFVLHEVDDAVAYLKMLRKILKDNGQLFIVEWEKIDSPMGPPQHDRISVEEINQFLNEAGFVLQHHEMVNEIQYFCEAKKLFDRQT